MSGYVLTWLPLIIFRLEVLEEDRPDVDGCDDVHQVVVKLLVYPEAAPTVSDSNEFVPVDTDAVDRVATARYGLCQLSLNIHRKL